MQYPLQKQAKALEQHGRYGDDVLVHMNPAEVRGIAALSPTGGLTRNPVTGQPEAFLPMLIPMLASWGGSALAGSMGAGMLGTALAGGAASGLATTALTGDIKRGLISGVTGAALGSALGAAGKNASEAALTAGAETAATSAVPITDMSDVLTGAAAPSAPDFSAGLVGPADIGVQGTGIGVAGSGGIAPPPTPTFGQALKSPFQKGSNLMGEIMKPTRIMPIAAGLSTQAQMAADERFQEEADALGRKRDEKSRSDLEAAQDDLQRGYAMAQPFAQRGISPSRDRMSYRTPRYKEGGVAELLSQKDRDYFSGNPGYSGIDPVTVQQNLRGQYVNPAPPGYMHGFQPEWDWFTNTPPEGTAEEAAANQSARDALLEEYRKRYELQNPENDFFKFRMGGRYGRNDPIMSKAEGGKIGVNTSRGTALINEGGIANVETPMTAQPNEQEVQMLAMAILGQSENPDAVIEGFIGKYGPDVFEAIRKMVLQSVAPNSQTEGMVRGAGGGMDDQVMGTIAGQQDIAVSPGEYIVPADVVSGLGDGSSDAGATELDQMSDRVRMARQGGRIEQPQPIDPSQIMP